MAGISSDALANFLLEQKAQGRKFGPVKPVGKVQDPNKAFYDKLRQQATEAARAGVAQQAKSDWDPLWRPLEATLNTISSPLVGIENAVSKGIGTATSGNSKAQGDYALWSTALLPIAPIAKAINPTGNYGIYGDYTDGFFASLNGDYESANYMTGHKLIEQATDDIGRLDPKYKNVQDNVNPWVKGIAGFGVDVALDPLTYVPGGIIASGARGAKAAAQGAKGLAKIPAAVKGITEGAAIAGAREGLDAAYKIGKFSNRVKPIGLDQWQQLRGYDKFEKIARKADIDSETLINLADGANVEEIAAQLGRPVEELSRLASRVQPYVNDAKTIGLGRAIALTNKIAGAGASLVNDIPIGNGATDPNILAHENDAVISEPAIQKNPTEYVEEAKAPVVEEAKAPVVKTSSPATISPANPTVYPENADIPYGSMDAELAAKGIPGAHLRARGGVRNAQKAAYDVAEFDAKLGAPGEQAVRDVADEFNFRTANFEHLVDAIAGPDSMAKAAYHLSLPPDVNLSELIFGLQKFDPADITPETLVGAVREIADMPFEIKGYTEPAREWVKRFDAAKAGDTAGAAANDIEGWSTRNGKIKPKAIQDQLASELYRRYEEGMARIGGAGSKTEFEGSMLGADGYFWREPTGQFVNIFGEVVDDPNLNLSALVQEIASNAKKISKGIVKQGDEALSTGAAIKTANAGTYGPGSSLAGRKAVEKTNAPSSQQMANPNIPAELASIYDHVAGFARVPIGGFEAWKQAVIAVANSTSSLAPNYKSYVTSLSLDKPGRSAKAMRKYSNYLRAFDTINDDEAKGVDLLGRVFTDKTSSMPAGSNLKNLKESAKAAEAKAASVRKGAKVVGLRAEKREAKGLLVDAKAAEKAAKAMSEVTPEQVAAAAKGADPVHTRATKASWLSASDEIVATLDGSVGANARSVVEKAKRFNGGLEGGKSPLHSALKQIMPTYRYRKGEYEVFPTAKPTTEALANLSKKLSEPGVFKEALSALTQNLGATDFEKLKTLLSSRTRPFYNLAEGTVDFDKQLMKRGFITPREGVDDLALKTSRQLWQNMPGVDTLIDDIAESLGLDVFDIDTKAQIWGAILESLQAKLKKTATAETRTPPKKYQVDEPGGFVKLKSPRNPEGAWRAEKPTSKMVETSWQTVNVPGHEIFLNTDKLFDKLSGIEFKTGEPPRAATYTDFAEPLVGQVIKEVSLNTKKWNGTQLRSEVLPREGFGSFDAAMMPKTDTTGREWISYKTPMDINRLKQVMANAGQSMNEIEPEFAQHVAQAIAKSVGPEEALYVSKLELGSPLIADYLRAKAPQIDALLTNSDTARMARIEAINDYTLMDGTKLREQARNIDSSLELQNSRGAIDGVYAKIADPRYVGSIKQSAIAGFERAITRLTSGGKDYRVFNQRAGYTAAKTTRAALAKVMPRKTQEFFNTYILALREQKQLLRESGIFEVTSLSPYGGKLASKETKDHDYAYIGFIDVMDAMLHSTPGTSQDLFRVAFDGFEINGNTFPMSVLQQAAVLSIKLDGAGVDKYGKIAALNDYMKAEIGKLDGFKEYADSIDLEVTSPAAGIVAQFATALSEPAVTSRLLERHRVNGSLAISMAEKDSVALTKPHLDAITQVARSLHTNTADRAKILDQSINALRKQLQESGFAKGSLQHAISMKMLDTHTLETFTPNELTSVRNLGRQLQAASEPEAVRAEAQNVERAALASGVIKVNEKIVPQQFEREFARLQEEGASEGELQLFTEAVMRMEQTSIENSVDHIGELIIDSPQLGGAVPRAIKAAKEADAAKIRSFLPEGAGDRAGQMLSGRFGNEDFKHLVAGKESAIGNSQARMGKEIESIAKTYGDKIAGTRMGEILGRYLAANDGYGREGVRETLNPVEKEFIDSVAARVGFLFDGTYFTRAGLSTTHYNRYVATGPLSALGDIGLLGKDLTGNAAKNDFKKHYSEELLKGNISWLDFMQGTNYAMHQAMLVPNIAADLSARIGSKAYGISDADAAAAGWVKIAKDDDGALGKWMVKGQYYHPSDLKQLAVVQKALEYPAALNYKIIKASDNITTVVKASLTVWNPAHHIVSIMGEIFMNTLAGVGPKNYVYAARMMAKANDLKNPFARNTKIGANDFGGLKLNIDDLLAEGPGIPVRFFKGGNKVISDEQMYRLLDEEGILLTQNSAEDLITVNGELAGRGNAFTRFFAPVIKANRGLGEFSARRDNIPRLAHAMQVATSRTFKDPADMLDQIRREVFEWHPTMQMLSPFERKYARRAFFFYTWQRGAMNKIIESITERPAALMVPIKMNYEASSIGGEPQGFGHPMPNDPNLPDFMARNIMGPHWYDENGNVQSISFSAPQLDLLQQFFGAIQFDPNQDLAQNLAKNAQVVLRGNTVNQMAPIPKLGIESMTGVTMIGDTPRQIVPEGADIIPEVTQHLIDQTGLGRLSKITGVTPFGQRSDATDPNEQATRAEQLIKNTFTGLKFNDASKYSGIAEQQRQAYFKQQLEELANRLNGGQ